MKLYVLTLEEDVKRREVLQKRFPIYYKNFNFIYGFNEEYIENFILNSISIKKQKIALSNTEIACAMSHQRILENFLETEAGFALILEDDIIGGDLDIVKIEKIVPFLPQNSILIAGGQEGLRSFKNLYGTEVDEKLDLYKIPASYIDYVSRACCYLVSRGAAEQIIRKQENLLDRADNWKWLLNETKDVYYSPILEHPLDLSHSHIEKDRQELKGKNILAAIWQQGIITSFYSYFRKQVTAMLAKTKQYKKLDRL